MSKSPELAKLHADLKTYLRPLAELAAETEPGAFYKDKDKAAAEEALSALTDTAVLAAIIAEGDRYTQAADRSGVTTRLLHAVIKANGNNGAAQQIVRGAQSWLFDAVHTIKTAGPYSDCWRDVVGQDPSEAAAD
jgi:hypothetical protein